MSLKKNKKGKANKAVLFVPITKVDEEKRLVYGTMIQGGVIDHADEIFDYASSKPNFEKWSSDVEKASDGKSLGNVRAMHSNVAAGKLTQIVFDDPNEIISCCAKIVDDAEWNKVIEGVYTGFSIGGSYTKKWKDGDAMRYTANPVEVSIVDVPCVPTATFDYAKADGTVVKTVFKAAQEYVPSNEDIARKATEMARAIAETESWVEHIEAARDALIKEDADKKTARQSKKDAKEKAAADAANDEADDANAAEEEGNEESDDEGGTGDSDEDEGDDDSAAGDSEDDKKKKEAAKAAARDQVSQVWRTTDGRTFQKKSAAIDNQAAINASRAAGPLAKAIAEAQAALGGDGGAQVPAVFADLATASAVLTYLHKVTAGDELRKSMYDVGWFARAIDELASIQACASSEADWEDDNSPVPAALKENIKALTITFIQMATEEAAEMIARMKPEEVESVVAGAKITDGVGATDGEDDSDDPEVAQHAAEAAKYLIEEKNLLEKARAAYVEGEELQKVKTAPADDEAAAEALAKVAAVETERDTLRVENAALQKQITDSVPAIKKLTDEIVALKAKPGPSAPRTSVVEKINDRAPGQPAQVSPSDVEGILAKMTTDERTNLLIRVSQAQPQQLLERGTK